MKRRKSNDSNSKRNDVTERYCRNAGDIKEKKFSVTVINKQTCKQKTYKDKKIMSDLIIRCIGE